MACLGEFHRILQQEVQHLQQTVAIRRQHGLSIGLVVQYHFHFGGIHLWHIEYGLAAHIERIRLCHILQQVFSAVVSHGEHLVHQRGYQLRIITDGVCQLSALFRQEGVLRLPAPARNR